MNDKIKKPRYVFLQAQYQARYRSMNKMEQHYNLAASSLPALKRATFFALILITAPV